MEHKLKLPAQCALIPPEEQQLVSGGAPAWMTDFVTDVKDTLRPYKPYFQFAWQLLKAGVTCAKEALLIYGYTKISSFSGQCSGERGFLFAIFGRRGIFCSAEEIVG